MPKIYKRRPGSTYRECRECGITNFEVPFVKNKNFCKDCAAAYQLPFDRAMRQREREAREQENGEQEAKI